MSDDNAIPNKAAETDSTPAPIGQPDHIDSDPTATPTPDASPNPILFLRPPVYSEGPAFLSPLFMEVASALVYDFNMYLVGEKMEDISWVVPKVLVTIIDSKISADYKLYLLTFFLRFVSIIIMVNYYDPSEYAENFGDLVPDGEALTKEAIFASLLSELSFSLAIKDSEYVFYRKYWYHGLGESESGEAAVSAYIYETLAQYLAQFVKLP